MEPRTIAEQLLFSTVLIQNENKVEKGIGTGFIFVYKKDYPFIVTNRHVVEYFNKCKIRFHIKKDGQHKLGNNYNVTILESDRNWYFHKDPAIDIAILPIAEIHKKLQDLGIEIYYKCINEELLPSVEQYQEFDAIEEVIFYGYPDGVYDSVNNLPIIRKGITSSPISIDFENRPTFLVDASVFKGSSGSPVFRLYNGIRRNNNGIISYENNLVFLGILSEVYYRKDRKTIETRRVSMEEKTVDIEEMIDLGIVYKSLKLIEVIEDRIKENNIR
jgi:hypothetical protein